MLFKLDHRSSGRVGNSLPDAIFIYALYTSWPHPFIIIFAIFENFAVQYLLLGVLAPW
jgi:hypothetical protein